MRECKGEEANYMKLGSSSGQNRSGEALANQHCSGKEKK